MKIFKNNKKLLFLFLAILLTIIYGIQSRILDLGFGITTNQRIGDFATLFLGLIVEATPFVVLGALVSALVALYIKEEWVLNRLPKNRFLSHLIISFTGIFMPVCECGNVPVFRRLLLKGFKPSHGITFLLAAPIINPITLWSTFVAFEDIDQNVVLLRFVGAIVIANIIGLIFSFQKKDKYFLTENFWNYSCNHDHNEEIVKTKNKDLITFLKQSYKKGSKVFKDEFLITITMLIIGAAIAAISQTFIPRNVIVGIATDPFLAIIAMILLSFVISICANVDAFFARTYADSFTLGPLLSFMVFGPMIDIKMLAMLKNTLNRNILIILTILVTLLSIIFGILITIFYI